MPKENDFPTLLPAEEKHTTKPLEAGSVREIRRNISVACTECQKRKTKCSGTAPCTGCATKGQVCLYDQTGDRRRKEYTAGLLKFHTTLCWLIATLRSEAPQEISWLVSLLQILPTDQDAVDFVVQMLNVYERTG